MPSLPFRFTKFGLLILTALAAAPDRAKAQSYPIDCAILLCLSGGWPASEPCARARAEFIRRITPWPVEPPLQIWRCPMGASFERGDIDDERARFYDILFDEVVPELPWSTPEQLAQDDPEPLPAVYRSTGFDAARRTEDFALRLIQDRADVDISGPEFNFVRSIRVFHVRSVRQFETHSDDMCNRSALVMLGTYRTQGEFSWQYSSLDALPEAHVGTEGYGEYCPHIRHQSVFVEWRDYAGNYGFEQVDY